jgi:hypothetical protein
VKNNKRKVYKFEYAMDTKEDVTDVVGSDGRYLKLLATRSMIPIEINMTPGYTSLINSPSPNTTLPVPFNAYQLGLEE